ncbi:MAG: hypothetical protein IT223_12775 [Crocinitomicaceae bacterium]|nr:hypothetical protein [Crocinitomicaceae bacterium]
MKNGILTFLLMALSVSLLAQKASKRHTTTIAFGMQATQPTGEFAGYYSGIPFGVSGNLSIPVKHSAFELGGLFAWNNMDSNEEEVNVLIGTDETGDDIYSTGTMRVRTNTRRYHVFARLRPFTGKFQPYCDAFTGLQSYSTSTDIQIDNSGYTSSSDEQVNQKDLTTNFGWAAGIRIRLTGSLFVDTRFEKIEGGRATYVDPESVQVNERGDNIDYDVRESKTNQYTYQLGLAFQF